MLAAELMDWTRHERARQTRGSVLHATRGRSRVCLWCYYGVGVAVTIIFDLDGTLADPTHRLHFIQQQPKDWDGFYAACGNDRPIWSIMNILMSMRRDSHRIEIWSGRSDTVRQQTENWLFKYGVYYDRLVMRYDGDRREDYILKGEWLDALPSNAFPKVVFEDRQSVVDMWRSRGVICCQVAPGNF